MKQVEQFWSMLDDLSQNDPAAYRGFIQRQMKEGAEFSSPPELDSCLCTEMLVSSLKVKVAAGLINGNWLTLH